jgi:hypothetical protein
MEVGAAVGLAPPLAIFTREITNMKHTKPAAIVLSLAGVVFLVPPVQQAINGKPLSLTPALAAAIGLFLGAIVNLVLSMRSSGTSSPPGA